MSVDPFEIDPKIERAQTLPATAYWDRGVLEHQKEAVFARAWHFVGHEQLLKTAGRAIPVTLMEGCLDEPLVLTRDDDDRIHCLSNVCTHRGNILVEGDCQLRNIRCRYHGRRFGLDGRFLSTPGFEDAEAFPSEKDNLPEIALSSWGSFLFCSLDPAFAFEELIEPLDKLVGWMPVGQFLFDSVASQDYLIQANWALYCDNYLEGFHIPYIHQRSLADSLDQAAYVTELFRWGSLQIGVARSGEDAFDLPERHPHYGSKVAAYYFWLFPNLMLNFYPWGLSVNVVQPLNVDRTRVSFRSNVWDESKRGRGAGSAIHRVEMEDEEIVELVQRGVRSRLYDRGRYSPHQERGVHHFHRLLAEMMFG